MLNLRFFLAAYGRLLFPSLVAMHVIMAAIFMRALRRPRALAAVTLGIVAVCGLLFGWTAWYRLAPTVRQPPEDVRILTGVRQNVLNKPVWEMSLAQPLIIPAGDLAALRLSIFRVGNLPQVGASIEGIPPDLLGRGWATGYQTASHRPRRLQPVHRLDGTYLGAGDTA